MPLLDTNVVSELRKLGRSTDEFRLWARSTKLSDHYLSVVTLLELRLGLLRLRRRDPAQAAALESWLENHLLPNFQGRILPLDTAVSLQCAELHLPGPRSDRDAWMAATALVHNLTVVTRNTRDFQGTGARLFNPWLADA